jgi:transcriptional antiterminator NusG
MSDTTLEDDNQSDDAQDDAVPAASQYAYSSGGEEDEEPLSPFAAALRAIEESPEEADGDESAAEVELEEAAEVELEEAVDDVAGETDAAEVTAETPPVEAEAPAVVADAPDTESTELEPLEEEEEEEPEPISPYDMPGDWYVVHSYSGYENKVKTNLMTRTSSMHMEDRIFEVVIPMENVIEIKNGQRVEVPKKMFPGYILVRMYLDDDSWYAVRNTPGVTGFVGSGSKPTPLSRREVERFLGAPKAEEKKSPRFKPAWEIGETVRVITGPFADFNGVIEDINVDQQKVTVLVSIFGRDTPMELNFEDIQKQ